MNLLKRFASLFPRKDIGNGAGDVFFWRYTLLKTRWFSVYLHEFLRSDHDRCLHDHPWPFLSIILAGGYHEEMRAYWQDGQPAWWLGGKPRPTTRNPAHYQDYGYDGWEDYRIGPTKLHWRRPGTILIRKATDAHRILIPPCTRPWSLVIVGKKSRDWGFYGPTRWIMWRPVQGQNPICEDSQP